MDASAVVGNDVIDLGDPEALASSLHPRFAARVLTPAERMRVEASDDPLALLWAHFAAKEAAFKALRKRRRMIFAHRAFEVAEDLHSVRHDGVRLALWLERTSERVHAVAFSGRRQPLARVEALEGAPGPEARRLLRALLASALACSPAALEVTRSPDPSAHDRLGPPRVLLLGRPLGCDVSLSHHGRFAACAALP